MRDFGKVYAVFWQDEKMRALSDDGRMLALYIMTSPHSNMIGCFRLPYAYVADDLQWSSERVREGFRELFAKGFGSRDETTGWVLIHRHLKWNAFENPNVVRAAEKLFDQVPDIPLKAALAKAFLDFAKHLSEQFRNRLRTLSKPFPNPEPEPEGDMISRAAGV